MWSHFVNAYVVRLQARELTEELENYAARELKNFAKGVERVLCSLYLPFLCSMYLTPLLQELPVSACTISVHLAAVEAHSQVPMTGPIREALCSLIERLNFRLVEQTQRRYPPP